MVARSAKDIERALLRKGFRYRHTHHRQIHFYHGEFPTGIFTSLSHDSRDYGDSLLALMSRQLHLSKAELLQFIDCEISAEDYAQLMRERGHIA